MRHYGNIFKTARFTPEEAWQKADFNNPISGWLPVQLLRGAERRSYATARTMTRHTNIHYHFNTRTHTHAFDSCSTSPSYDVYTASDVRQTFYTDCHLYHSPRCSVLSITVFIICTARSHHVISLKYCFDKYVDSLSESILHWCMIWVVLLSTVINTP